MKALEKEEKNAWLKMNKLTCWFKKGDRVVCLVYGALALVVLLPLFRSGYVFAMDMAFVPNLSWPEPFNVIRFFLYFLNFIFPGEIVQKIFLFLVLFLAGIGMHRLIPSESRLPKYFAGIFYVFNPWVYSRFMFGQWFLAYALMPFAVKAIFDFFNKINLKNALKLSFWFVLIGFTGHHFIVFLFLFFAAAFFVYLFKALKERKEIFGMFKHASLILLIFFVFSAWWILPYFNTASPQGHLLQEAIGQKDFESFKTEGDAKYGVLLNVAALYGFWGDRMDQYILPKDVIQGWFLLFLIILALAVFGMISALKKNKPAAITFIIVALISFVLSAGIAYQPFAPIINFLNEKTFIFQGFRDSQKFSALLVLAYAYFGAVGINAIFKHLIIQRLKYLKLVLAVFLIGLPVLYSPLMVWGFCGQLYASHYPQEWFKTNQILNQDKEDFKVLFLPWHQYMPFSFIGNKVVVNPAPQFFDKETIAGDNMEIGVYTHSKRPVSKAVEEVVLGRIQGIDNFGEMLAPFNIKYIILAKEADWLEYNFLDRQSDLEPFLDSKKLRIYQNKSWSN